MAENKKKKVKKPSIGASFLRQLIAFAIFMVLLFLGLRFFMKTYTNHGQKIQVEDYRELSFEEATSLIKKNKLQYSIQDSTYNASLPPGTIIDQNPRPNSFVKKKRTVYLVVNSDSAPPVKMPDLIDNSLRQAELQLKNMGLKVGKVTYRPDIAKAVLEQRYKGKKIKPGATILKGEAVDLVIGDGYGNTTMRIPNLVGLEYGEALITLNDAGLRVGNLHKQGNIADLNAALIIEQSPVSKPGMTLEQGQSIDLYVTGMN